MGTSVSSIDFSRRDGPVNASSDDLTVTIEGRPAHAAYPHMGRDPIVAAAGTVMALQHLVSRRIDPMHPSVVTVGTLQAGNVHLLFVAAAVAAMLLFERQRHAAGGAILAYAIVGPVYLAYALWNWAIGKRGIARTVVYAFLVPVLGGAMAVFFLNETVGLAEVAGAVLVVAGLVVTRLSSRRVPVRAAEDAGSGLAPSAAEG